MYEVGRVCFKIAGRDANNYCVVVEKIDDLNVLIDGQVRRKKVNVKHLEPTSMTMDIKSGADHSIIVEAFSKYNIKIANKKPKKPTVRPKKQKVQKTKPVKKAPKKSEKKSEKKTEKKTEEKKAIEPKTVNSTQSSAPKDETKVEQKE